MLLWYGNKLSTGKSGTVIFKHHCWFRTIVDFGIIILWFEFLDNDLHKITNVNV